MRVADALHCRAAYIANNARPSGRFSPAPFAAPNSERRTLDRHPAIKAHEGQRAQTSSITACFGPQPAPATLPGSSAGRRDCGFARAAACSPRIPPAEMGTRQFATGWVGRAPAVPGRARRNFTNTWPLPRMDAHSRAPAAPSGRPTSPEKAMMEGYIRAVRRALGGTHVSRTEFFSRIDPKHPAEPPIALPGSGHRFQRHMQPRTHLQQAVPAMTTDSSKPAPVAPKWVHASLTDTRFDAFATTSRSDFISAHCFSYSMIRATLSTNASSWPNRSSR